MAKIGDILDIEKDRTDNNKWNIIHLFKEGGFYRAYEWSAWLIKTITCTEEFQQNRGDSKILSVSRYKTKNNDYVMLGFPLESINKFIPESVEIKEEGENCLSIRIEVPGDKTFEDLNKEFKSWRESLSIAEKKVSSIKEISNSKRSLSFLESPEEKLNYFKTKILSFPTETSNLVEILTFVIELKQEMAKL